MKASIFLLAAAVSGTSPTVASYLGSYRCRELPGQLPLALVLELAHPDAMPRWLTILVVILLFVIFVLPDPAAAGNATGNALHSLAVFFRTAVNELSYTSSTAGGSGSGGSGTAGSGGGGVYPSGGVASGDGTTNDDSVLLGLEPASVRVPVATLPSEAVNTSGATLSYSPPVLLRIPSIGVTSGFVGLGLAPDGTMQVPKVAHVVGWYRDSPTPGERGPAVATAHVDWKHEKGVFHDLGQLKPGNDVTVDRADGAAAVFQVTRVAEYRKAQFPTHEVYGRTAGAELRLITCGGRYDPDTHNYEDNIVVFARMVAVD